MGLTPANTSLSASTVDWLVTSDSGASNGVGFRVSTNNNATADSGATAGWSIGTGLFKRASTDASWSTSSNRIRFEVKGTVPTTSTTNTAPTASNRTVTTNEDTDYTFAAANFNFADTDTGDALSSVKIVTLPATGKGTLKLSGTAVTANAAVTKAQLDAGNLKYTPPANANGTGYASFTFRVNDGTDDSTSAYTMTIDVTAVNDPATGTPTITGTAQVGQTLTAVTTGIMDADGLSSVSYTYQWIRVNGSDADISGATSSTYTLLAADQGKTIKVKVSFTDDASHPETRTSAATAAVTAAANNPATGAPTITGTAQVGQTLTAVTTGIMDADGLSSVSYTYQWIRVNGSDADISGATSSTYTLLAADEGKTIKVKVSFTDDASHPETRTSAATAAVTAAANNPATGAPTITGTAQVGQTLTAVTTGIMDADGLSSVSYTYQWIRVNGSDADISGATSSTYTLLAADQGKTIKVKVSFTDDASHSETRTSAATAAVTAVADTDTTVPTVTITGVPAMSSAPFMATFTFSEAVTGFVVGDITLGNATAANFTDTSTSVYTALITPTAEGTVTVDVEAGVAQDAARNGNTAASRASSSYTASPSPVISIVAGTSPVTEGTAATFTLTRTGNATAMAAAVTVDVSVFESEAMISGTAPTSVMLAANARTATLRVPTERDDVDEADSEVTVRLNNADANADVYYLVDYASQASVTVRDDDLPTIKIEAGGSPVTKGEQASFLLYREGYVQEPEPLTVQVRITETGDVLATPRITEVEFTTGLHFAYLDQETVSNDTDDADSVVTATVVASPATYKVGTPASATVTVSDDTGGGPDDTQPPVFTGATVSGSTLVLTYDEALDGASIPAAGDFAVTAAGSTVTVTGVGVAGSAVTLTLATAVEANQAVTLAYTPGANPTQDAAGNDAVLLSRQTVTNNTGNTPATGAPTITGTAEVGQTLTAVTTGIMDANGLTSPTYTYQWIRVNGTEADISGANSSTYTLVAADLGKTLKVRVRFDDDDGNTEMLTSAATATVVAAGTVNAAPVFPSASATRSVAEHTAAATNIGAVIPEATDADSGDTLTYSMEGPDAASFNFNASTRQITTKAGVTYDHEAKSSYSVTIKVDDGHGGMDTVAVTITITDVNEPPPTNAPPVFPSTSATRRVAEHTAAGEHVGAPVTATDADHDPLTYTLEGADAASFDIDAPSGQIRTKAGVTYDHETTSSYVVTVKADDGHGGTDTITVTITVTAAPPPPVGTIPDQTLRGGARRPVDVAPYFRGAALTYTAQAADARIVTVEVSGSTVTLTPVDGGRTTVTVTAQGPEGTAAQTFAVDRRVVVAFAAAAYDAREGGPAVAVPVRLDYPAVQGLVMPITGRPEGSTAPGDYTVGGLDGATATAGTGTLTFPAGATEQTLTVTANADADGDDEAVALGFGPLPAGVDGGAPATARVTLTDQGLVPLTVSFAQAAYTVTEGGDAVRIDVALAPAADRRVTVPLEVTWPGGPARADVTGVPASIVFEVGMAAATIAVTVPRDEAHTPDERLVLRVGALPAAVLAGAPAATTVTILQVRSAAAFERSMAVTLAVTARAVAESAQSAIAARVERYRQVRQRARAGVPEPQVRGAGAPVAGWTPRVVPVGAPDPGAGREAAPEAPQAWHVVGGPVRRAARTGAERAGCRRRR